jgi:hypothetical protein
MGVFLSMDDLRADVDLTRRTLFTRGPNLPMLRR